MSNKNNLHIVVWFQMTKGKSIYGVMTKLLDYSLEENEFALQSCYHVQCRTNSLGKDMNPLSLKLWVT